MDVYNTAKAPVRTNIMSAYSMRSTTSQKENRSTSEAHSERGNATEVKPRGHKSFVISHKKASAHPIMLDKMQEMKKARKSTNMEVFLNQMTTS